MKALTAGSEIDSYCTRCRMDLGHRIVALVAILCCGATYVPLDISDPPARRADLLGRSNVKILLTTRGCCHGLIGYGATVRRRRRVGRRCVGRGLTPFAIWPQHHGGADQADTRDRGRTPRSGAA